MPALSSPRQGPVAWITRAPESVDSTVELARHPGGSGKPGTTAGRCRKSSRDRKASGRGPSRRSCSTSDHGPSRRDRTRQGPSSRQGLTAAPDWRQPASTACTRAARSAPLRRVTCMSTPLTSNGGSVSACTALASTRRQRRKPFINDIPALPVAQPSPVRPQGDPAARHPARSGPDTGGSPPARSGTAATGRASARCPAYAADS